MPHSRGTTFAYLGGAVLVQYQYDKCFRYPVAFVQHVRQPPFPVSTTALCSAVQWHVKQALFP
jgi:hypothetical protein